MLLPLVVPRVGCFAADEAVVVRFTVVVPVVERLTEVLVGGVFLGEAAGTFSLSLEASGLDDFGSSPPEGTVDSAGVAGAGAGASSSSPPVGGTASSVAAMVAVIYSPRIQRGEC